MVSDRRWRTATVEHEAVVAEFAGLISRVPEATWQQPMAEGKWSPAELAVHVTRAYEFGVEAAKTGAGMKLRVGPARAWILGHTLFPLLIALRRFPTGAKAPREVRPDVELARGLSRESAVQNLQSTAARALSAITTADGSKVRITHAYFGALSPYRGLQLLSGHTRHHARQLTAFLGRE